MTGLLRKTNLKFSDFSNRIDWEKLYDDLGWEPQYSRGAEDKGYCLMPQNHKSGDTTGKLAINRDKAVYNCWVCGGGSILSLVMEVKGMKHDEALQYLYQFVDSSTKESADDFYARIARILADETQDTRSVSSPVFNDRVLEQWNASHEWFDSRHISDGVRSYFKAGYDPVAKRYSPKHGTYEGPGIILPHFWGGKLVGWQTRWLDGKPDWVTKFTNTTDFPRETTVWGFDFAASQEKQPIIVESVPTALYLISEGYPAVATFGAEVTEAQLRHMRQFQQGVILAADNDEPGSKWLAANTNYLERYIPVLIAPRVQGHGSDLGDLHPNELSSHLKGTKPHYVTEIPEG